MSHEEEIAKEHELPFKFNLLPHTTLRPYTDRFMGFDTGLLGSDLKDFVLSPEYGRHAQDPSRFKPGTFPQS